MESSNNQVVKFEFARGKCHCKNQEIGYEWAQSKKCVRVDHYQHKLQAVSAVEAGVFNHGIAPVIENPLLATPLWYVGIAVEAVKRFGGKKELEFVPRAYHDSLFVIYDCHACNHRGAIVFEYNADTGMLAKIGGYADIERQYAWKQLYMPMTEAIEVFNSIDKNPEDYNLVTYNCQDFARALFNQLK